MSDSKTTNPHPWYGPCDTLLANGGCAKCAKEEKWSHPLSISEARMCFAEVLERAEMGQRTVIARHGKPVAIIVPIGDIQGLSVVCGEIITRSIGLRTR